MGWHGVVCEVDCFTAFAKTAWGQSSAVGSLLYICVVFLARIAGLICFPRTYAGVNAGQGVCCGKEF